MPVQKRRLQSFWVQRRKEEENFCSSSCTALHEVWTKVRCHNNNTKCHQQEKRIALFCFSALPRCTLSQWPKKVSFWKIVLAKTNRVCIDILDTCWRFACKYKQGNLHTILITFVPFIDYIANVLTSVIFRWKLSFLNVFTFQTTNQSQSGAYFQFTLILHGSLRWVEHQCIDDERHVANLSPGWSQESVERIWGFQNLSE